MSANDKKAKFIYLDMKKYVLSIFLVIFISGCVFDPLDDSSLPSRGYFMGLLPTPAVGQSFEEVYRQASQYCEFSPVWGRPTPFYNLSNDIKGEWGITFIKEYIRDNGMFPIINISFYGNDISLIVPPGVSGNTLSDKDWRKAYKKAVVDVVKVSKPLFLSVGNEVNRWYEKYGINTGDPNGFENYVSLYNEIYDEVKKLSPKIKIFCTFAREIVSEHKEANLDILSLFNVEKLDIIVFTSYPFAVEGINRPSNIRNDYYSKIFSENNINFDKPFGFSELAWISRDEFGGQEAQSEFLHDIVTRLTIQQGMNLYLLGWTWLHDIDNNDTIGLIRYNGTEKIAYQTWKEISLSNN